MSWNKDFWVPCPVLSRVPAPPPPFFNFLPLPLLKMARNLEQSLDLQNFLLI